MPFRICSIGCSDFSSHTHGPSYRKYASLHPGVVLAGCCAAHDESAKAFKDKFGFQRHYTDFERMLESEKPDAVCLMVPVHLTALFAVRILEMGYPLLMEKPPGRNRNEALAILDAAERTGVPNQVAFNRRYAPLVRELKRLLSGGFPAETIQNIRLDFLRVGRTDADFSTTAIHGIDAVKFLAGSDYRFVRLTYQEMPRYGENVANIFLDCAFESGAMAQLGFCPVGCPIRGDRRLHAAEAAGVPEAELNKANRVRGEQHDTTR